MTVPILEGNAITDVTSNASSATITLPAGVSLNDIIIIICAIDGDAANPQGSGGMTMLQFGGVSEGTIELYYLWGRAAGGETTQNITWTGNEQGRFMALRISGCVSVGSPIDAIGTGSTVANSDTKVVLFFNSTVIDTLGIQAVTVDRNRVDAADTLITPNGWTEVGVSGSSGGANGAGLLVGEKDLPAVGGSGQSNWGTWAADACCSRGFNLKSVEPITSEDSEFAEVIA